MTETTKLSTAIAPYGSRDDVREIVTRLKMMTPGGGKLGGNELLALAQGAVAHGLDPLNGEIWIIPGRGLMIGVKGLRKKAREQVKGNFWIDFRAIENLEERALLRIPAGALAYEARLFDTENIRTYAETAERLLKAGIPWDAVKEMVGSKPYSVGIGVLKEGEQTKMQPVQCAMKRAEADALKRRFDVPFGLAVESENDEPVGPWIEGETVDRADEPPAAPEDEYVPDPAEIDAGLAAMQAKEKAQRTRDKAAIYPE